MLCEFHSEDAALDYIDSLNPCYSGICSVRAINAEYDHLYVSLNPCYSGICSVRRNKLLEKAEFISS